MQSNHALENVVGFAGFIIFFWFMYAFYVDSGDE